MQLRTKLLIGLISFNLLTSQLGLNIFINYCCCAKSQVISFIPKEDHCKKASKSRHCCAIGSQTFTLSFKKAPCSNKVLGHKSLESIAEKPSQKSFEFQFNFILNKLELPCLLNNINAKVHSTNFNDPHFLSGTQKRIKYCSLTC